MKFQIKIVLFIFLLFASAMSLGSERLTQGIERLRFRIDILEQVSIRYQVAEKYRSGFSFARMQLKTVEKLNNNNNVSAAEKLFLKVKQRVDIAAKFLLVKPALRISTELDNLIGRAESLVQTSNNSDARYMLTRARSFRVQAADAFKQSRYFQAQEFHRIATYFANKSIELAQGIRGAVSNEQRYRQILENIKSLYRDISSAGADNPILSTLLQKSLSAIDLARELYERGNIRQALLQLQISERLLYRAADLSQHTGEGRKERLRSNLISLERYIFGIKNSLKESGSNSDARLLRKANQFLQAARRDFENNELKQAESKIALAQRMATKALHFNAQTPQITDVKIEQRISDIQHLISLQKSKITPQNEQLVLYLHSRTTYLLQKAKNDNSAGNTTLAFQKVNIALRLVNRVEYIFSSNKVQTQTKRQLLERNKRVEESIRNISQSENTNQQISVMLPFLKQLLNRSRQAAEQGNLMMAEELLDLAQRQLNSLIKNAAK